MHASLPCCRHPRRAQESARLQAVLQHPTYQADPFGAILHHLEATMPPAPPAHQPAASRQRDKRGKKQSGRMAE